MFTLYQIVKRSDAETDPVKSVNRSKCSVALQVLHLLEKEQISATLEQILSQN